MLDLLDELRKEADTTRLRYQKAVDSLRAETEAAIQAGADPVALYGLGIFHGSEATDSDSRRSVVLLALRHEVDMSRMEYDDAVLRLQAERDEQHAIRLQNDTRVREETATSIQKTIRTATVAYVFLTAALLITAAVQAYAAWKQAHASPQAIPAPIVNIATPSLPPPPAPVVNVMIPLPTAQPTRSR